MLIPSLFFFLPLVFSVFIDQDSSWSSSESHEAKSGIGRKHSHRHRGGYGRFPRPRGPSYGGGKRPQNDYYGDDDDIPRPRPPPKSKCDDGWQFFERPTGGWCMKVFPATFDQYASQAQCVTHGATLSGLQNTAEINWVVSASLPVIAPFTSGGVWIGIQRRPECMGSKLTATCTKTNSFYWTDNSATGIEGMIFQQNEPNDGGMPDKSGHQNCALLSVANVPVFNAVSNYWSGQMDDIYCNSIGWVPNPGPTYPRANRAYLCGKKSRK